VREPTFRERSVFEAQASGPLHAVLRALPRYVCSEYFAGAAPGTVRDGVRCEDLQALSFADASLDLVLHSSVLEHLPRPQRALAEAFRVLRPGGHLVFEVPMTDGGIPGLREKSVLRVDTSTGMDVPLLPRVYHDDPLSARGALVYTDFGTDLLALLGALGFEARLEVRALAHSSMSHAVVVIARKPGP
jgi:SAM-dependent methyltransferase